MLWRYEQHERSWTELWSRSTAIGLYLFANRDLRGGTAVVDYAPLFRYPWDPVETVSYDVGGWSAGFMVELAAGW